MNIIQKTKLSLDVYNKNNNDSLLFFLFFFSNEKYK